MTKTLQASIFGGLALALAFAAQAQDYRSQAVSMMKRDFHAKGIAKMDRLDEDSVQLICNRSHNSPPKDVAERLEQDQRGTIEYPADGKFLGDWKAGDKIAESGKGMTWKDGGGKPSGGSCYNCHEIGPKQTSFGNIGPSLRDFGKKHGYGAEVQKYVYGKIYNAKAFSLCSKMPRFGHAGALTEAQIKDLVALLLDPKSPVNK